MDSAGTSSGATSGGYIATWLTMTLVPLLGLWKTACLGFDGISRNQRLLRDKRERTRLSLAGGGETS